MQGDSVSNADPDLSTALIRLHKTIDESTYPLVLDTADEARRVGAALITQIDDYLLPRLARLDAPLLVVVGGSTGSGKSTLVNSLVQARVSPAGVLRPTTRSPVLVCHPSDTPWFQQADLLPGLRRTTRPGDTPQTLQIVAAPALTPGLALLDAPDIDSVVEANRTLAAQLLAAADLWLFVTTAARYADAVPWELLHTARLRGTVIALVLDRVPQEAADEISNHLSEMLAAQGLGLAPLFVIPETHIDGQGLLPERTTTTLRNWFSRLAGNEQLRAAVVRQTLDGALAALYPAVTGLAAAADDQAAAAKALDERVEAAYRGARRSVKLGLRDGRLLRGEVLACWQEFLDSGELLRTLQARVSRLRDRVTSAPHPGHELQNAIESQLVTLLHGVIADATETAYSGWQAHPAGAALLEPALARPGADLPERARQLVRDWQRDVVELVRTEVGGKRRAARGAAYTLNAAGLTIMIIVFASTALIPTGLEVAAGAGTTIAGQKILEAVFGDQAVRALVTRAHDNLILWIDLLLEEEADRFRRRLDAVGVDTDHGERLRRTAHEVEWARRRAALTKDTSIPLPEVR